MPGKICLIGQGVPHAAHTSPPSSRQVSFQNQRIRRIGGAGTAFASGMGSDFIGEQRMTRTYKLALAVVAAAWVLTAAMPAQATSRIKDLASIEGVRQNQLIGYGLVVGLNGTGDTINNSPFTRQSLTAMLERLGVNIRGQTLRTGNVAAVMVTSNLPAFSTQGTRIDVTVSALGDAKSLQGGTLLVTPLLEIGRAHV